MNRMLLYTDMERGHIKVFPYVIDRKKAVRQLMLNRDVKTCMSKLNGIKVHAVFFIYKWRIIHAWDANNGYRKRTRGKIDKDIIKQIKNNG